MVIFRAPGTKKLPPLKHPDPTEIGHLLIVIWSPTELWKKKRST